MSFRVRPGRPSLLRRICAVLAVLGLLFAATVASVTHSVAMPMMGAGMATAGLQDDAAAHDCGSAAGDETPAPPMSSGAPCEQGCLLCKSCSLTGIVLPAAPAMLAAGPYRNYQPAVVLAPAGLAPAQPNEPPRH